MRKEIIKWKAFNSVTNTQKMLEEEAKKLNITKMPELSDEQLMHIQTEIEFSYYSNIQVTIEYFKKNHIYKIKGIIKKIDSINHLIKLNDNTIIFFNQIIKIQ